MITRSDVEKPSIPLYDGEIPRIESSMIIPHAAHGYAIGVEYVRDWFLSLFGDTMDKEEKKRFFKTIWVNGRHVMDNYKSYSSISLIKKAKPMVAFTPVPDMQYDRENIDVYYGNKDMYLRKFNHTKSFFKDYVNNIFLGMNVRDLRIGFQIKCRVETLAQQMNLYRKIEMYGNCGRTHYEYITADFHIPKEVIMNIAHHAGFEYTVKDGVFKLKDQAGFVAYLNKHSKFPITYKMRGMTGNNEYFMRVPNVWVHMNKTNKLDMASGNPQGQTLTDFDIDWDVELTIKVPSFYVYGSAKTAFVDIPLEEDSLQHIGLWTLRVLDVPQINSKGWNLYFSTTYEYDESELDLEEVEIDISSFFTEPIIKVMIESNLELNISPEQFLSISVFNFANTAECWMDWEKEVLHVRNNKDGKICFACYLDTEYRNKQMNILLETQNTRLSTSR